MDTRAEVGIILAYISALIIIIVITYKYRTLSSDSYCYLGSQRRTVSKFGFTINKLNNIALGTDSSISGKSGVYKTCSFSKLRELKSIESKRKIALK